MAKKVITKCSPDIWRNFNGTEKVLWQYFFERFLITVPLSQPGRKENSVISEKAVAVIAHNAACEVVWSLTGLLSEAAHQLGKKLVEKL